MKRNLRLKFFLPVSLLFFAMAASAQITITRSDFGNAGDFAIMVHDTLHSTVTRGNAGASQTWTLTSLLNHFTDTTNFLNPASTPYAASFPSSNLAGYNTLDSSYYYINASSTGIYALGLVTPNPFTGNPLILSFSPVITQITFPSNMASAFTVTNATSISTFYYHGTYTVFTYDSVRVTTTINRNSIIDGWGIATTPAASLNALRQKLTEYTVQVVDAYIVVPPLGWQNISALGTSDTTIHYTYFANGQNWALAEINTNPAGNVTRAQYLLNPVNGIKENAFSGNKDVVFYPNPSAGETNISVLNRDAAALEVFDMFGRKTETLLLDNNSIRHSFSSHADGLYMFRVLDKNGKIISTGKLILEK